MTIHFKILILFFCLLRVGHLLGQTTYSVCEINTVYSQNNDFFLITIPFDNIEQTSTGKTTVFNKDSIQIYQIPIHFEVSRNRKELFLSDDGQTIVYVIDQEFSWNGTLNKSVRIFRKGELVTEYGLTDLIKCDSDNEDCFLFYKEAIDSTSWNNGKREITDKDNSTTFQKRLTKRATLIEKDTLYIFAKTNKLLKIDLISSNLISRSIQESDSVLYNQINSQKIYSEKFKPSSLYGLPSLSNGISLEKAIAKHLDMAVYPEDEKGTDNFKQYSANIEIIVDKEGNAVLDKIKNYDALLEEKIKAFIESSKFDSKSIPSKTEKWRFDGWVTLMNKSKKEAKREKQLEIIEEREAYKRRIIADSINGVYIPKNLEECFLELNKLLKPKDVQAIKSLKSKDELSSYHLGLGMWLRNNWGLWGGSRLQQYFFEKEIEHPDNMSGIILNYYFDWLNGINEGWQTFENK